MPAAELTLCLPDKKGALFSWPTTFGNHPKPGSLCVLGAPSDTGNAIMRGTSHGPSAIRAASQNCKPPNEFGYDIGDIDFSNRWGSASHLEAAENAVRQIVDAGQVPFLLGGDHSLTFAPVSVLQETQDICVVWYDAHTDFSPWNGQDFHNHKQVLRRIKTLPGVTRVVQIGYRGVTVGDERNLGSGATVVTSAGMRKRSASEMLSLIPKSLPCYISIDIDVIDPFCAPGTSAPVPGGVLPDQLTALLRLIARHRLIAGADVVEVNPVLDREDDTSRIAVNCIEALAANWDSQFKQQQAVKRTALSGTNSPRELAR